MPKYRKFLVHKTQDFDILEMPDDFTRLLWVMLPLGLDREGRGIYDAKWVKAQIMPMREDVTAQMVRSAMDWYWRRGLITRYKAGNREYFYYTAWVDEQGECTKEAESTLPSHHRAQIMSPADELPLFDNSCNGAKLLHEHAAPFDAMPTASDNSCASPAQVQPRSSTDAQVDAYADAQVDTESIGADAPAPEHLPSKKADTPGKKQKGAKLPRERDALFDAISEVCSADAATAGASIGNVKKALLKASPPYTPDEVRAFGEWYNSDEWRRQKGPPSLWNLKEKIGVVRSANGCKSQKQNKLEQAIAISRQHDAERAATRAQTAQAV